MAALVEKDDGQTGDGHGRSGAEQTREALGREALREQSEGGDERSPSQSLDHEYQDVVYGCLPSAQTSIPGPSRHGSGIPAGEDVNAGQSEKTQGVEEKPRDIGAKPLRRGDPNPPRLC
jgi:hypothetical protein